MRVTRSEWPDQPAKPKPLNAHVSSEMKRMPRRDSGPEVRLRSELHRRGLRFRSHRKDLPGRPDIAFSAAKVAVFVDGCFWHACPDHGVLPRNNREWWKAKLDANKERDRRKDAELEVMGWLPIHIWEHEDARTAAGQIERIVRARRDAAEGQSR